jgi:hypothetical protein
LFHFEEKKEFLSKLFEIGSLARDLLDWMLVVDEALNHPYINVWYEDSEVNAFFSLKISFMDFSLVCSNHLLDERENLKLNNGRKNKYFTKWFNMN